MNNIDQNYWRAEKLVRDFPDDAIKLVAKNCDPDELDATLRLCLAPGYDYRPHQRSNVTQVSGDGSPPDLRRARTHASSFSSPENQPRVLSAHGLPPSPTLTNSTTKRRLSNKADIIELILSTETGYQSKPLSARPAGVRYSFVREDIVHRSGLANEAFPCQNSGGQLSVQHKDAPNGIFTATHQVLLTWRRSGGKTNEGDFYIVPDLIDADVLLGDETAGAQMLERNDARIESPTPERPRMGQRAVSALHEVAEPSVYRSSETSSSRTTVPHSTRWRVPPGQPPSGWSAERSEFGTSSQPRGLNTSQYSSEQSRRPNTSTSPSNASVTSWIEKSSMPDQSNQSGPFSDILRVKYEWGDDRTRDELDLGASYETFFQTLENILFRDFERSLDRSVNSVHFIQEFKTGKPKRHVLKLDERSLESDWPDLAEDLKASMRNQLSKIHVIIKGG